MTFLSLTQCPKAILILILFPWLLLYRKKPLILELVSIMV
jgi:hypothetical protein